MEEKKNEFFDPNLIPVDGDIAEMEDHLPDDVYDPLDNGNQPS